MTVRPLYLFTLAVFFALVVFLLHHRAFSGPMYYDSEAAIAASQHIFDHKGVLGVIGIFPQRPIPMISFYLDYLVGGMNAYYFRLVNTVLMSMTALMVVMTLTLLIEAPCSRIQSPQGRTRLVALVMGILFLTHPIQVFLVAYIWQRMALLAFLFYMAAFVLYLSVRSGRFSNSILGYALCVLMFFLAMLSKENAATLPAILVLAEIAFFRPGLRQLARQGLAITLLAFCVFAVSFHLESLPSWSGTDPSFNAAPSVYLAREMSLWQLFLTQCRMLFQYVSLIAAPFPGRLQLLTPQYISESLFESPITFMAVVGAILLTLCGIRLLWRRPLTGFGILFFVINLLPEGFLAPQYVLFLYRAPLPMVGLVMVITDAVMLLSAKFESTKAARWVKTGLIALAAGTVTMYSCVCLVKADQWRDPVVFWQDVVDHLPPQTPNLEKRSVVHALNQLGFALQRKDRHSEAVHFHERALRIPDNRAESGTLLGKAYLALGKIDEAERMFRLCITINPRFPEGLMGLAAIQVKKGSVEEALVSMRKAMDLAPKSFDYHVKTGIILLKLGDPSGATSLFSSALELNPKYAEAHYQLGKVLIDENPSLGLVHIQECLKLDPDHSLANVEMGVILAQSGDLEKAEALFRRALKRNPNDELAKKNLETVLQELGDRSNR